MMLPDPSGAALPNRSHGVDNRPLRSYDAWIGYASRERDMRFGERVRDLRILKGLSQRALGKQIGVSFTYVSKIENEKLHFDA
jgi:ribosome-binding protein aMBF1 (putative translation factor)